MSIEAFTARLNAADPYAEPLDVEAIRQLVWILGDRPDLEQEFRTQVQLYRKGCELAEQDAREAVA